jgi:hypothetical protein
MPYEKANRNSSNKKKKVPQWKNKVHNFLLKHEGALIILGNENNEAIWSYFHYSGLSICRHAEAPKCIQEQGIRRIEAVKKIEGKLGNGLHREKTPREYTCFWNKLLYGAQQKPDLPFVHSDGDNLNLFGLKNTQHYYS